MAVATRHRPRERTGRRLRLRTSRRSLGNEKLTRGQRASHKI